MNIVNNYIMPWIAIAFIVVAFGGAINMGKAIIKENCPYTNGQELQLDVAKGTNRGKVTFVQCLAGDQMLVHAPGYGYMPAEQEMFE